MESKISQGMLDKMAQISPDLFCTIDWNGKFIYVSEASLKILGYETEEITGHYYTEFLHPDYIASTEKIISDIVRGATINDFENCYIHRNGHAVHLLWSAVWSEEDEVLFCVARDITEQKRSRERLQENEQLYKILFDHNPDVLFIQDIEGMLREVNQFFCHVFGVSKDEAIGRPITSFIPSELLPMYARYFEESLLGSSTRYDLELLTAKKERRTYDAIQFPVTIKGKEAIYIKTILKDVTPIVHSYKTIQRQADKLNNIFESITDAFIMMDRDWRLTYINNAAEKMVQFDRSTHIGESLWDIFPEQVGGEFYTNYTHAFRTGEAVHFTSFLMESDLWLQVKAFPSDEGLSVYFDDVTDKIKAQQELEKLSLVASGTDNGVIITDAKGLTEWVNQGFTKMTGFTISDISGKKPGELLQGPETDEATVRSMGENIGKGIHFNTILINYKKSGEKFWVSMDIAPIRTSSGTLTHFIAIQRDITYMKEAEASLLRMAQDLYAHNKDLQQFTYIVSHNLRAPVANSIGLADLLTRVDKNSVLFDKTLANLNQSVLHMDTVIKDLNSILSIRDSRGAQELEKVNVTSVLELVISSQQESLDGCGGRVIIAVEEDLYVRANKAYLYSIFYNLLSNAIKYRSAGHALEVSISSYSSFGWGALISFSDNGSGFDMKRNKDKVFKLYKRFHTDKNGRGIGLYLIKTHLEAMGGHIEVASQVGIGTRFLIYIPRD